MSDLGFTWWPCDECGGRHYFDAEIDREFGTFCHGGLLCARNGRLCARRQTVMSSLTSDEIPATADGQLWPYEPRTNLDGTIVEPSVSIIDAAARAQAS